MKIFRFSLLFFIYTIALFANHHDDLLNQFAQAKKGVIFDGVVRDINDGDSCKIENWNNVQKYVCRCCIVSEVDKYTDGSWDARTILENCKKKNNNCTESLIAQLKADELLTQASDEIFVAQLYDRSRVIKDASFAVTDHLAKTGQFTEKSLKGFLVSLYKAKKLLEPAFSRVDCLTIQDLAGHYKPLVPYIAPNQVADFPVLDLPILYVHFDASGSRYFSIMPKAHGTEFLKVMNAYLTDPNDQNKERLQKGYRALGKTLANFHKKFMDKDSIDGNTITQGDLHVRNFFYDDATDMLYWIDNERMGKSTLAKRSPREDFDAALFMPFWPDNFLRFSSAFRNNPEPLFKDFYSEFFKAYLLAFGGDIKERAQELKKVLSQINRPKLIELSNKTIDELVLMMTPHESGNSNMEINHKNEQIGQIKK